MNDQAECGPEIGINQQNEPPLTKDGQTHKSVPHQEQLALSLGQSKVLIKLEDNKRRAFLAIARAATMARKQKDLIQRQQNQANTPSINGPPAKPMNIF